MNILKHSIIAICLLLSPLSQAATEWSSCETITAIANEMADTNGILVYLSSSLGNGCGAYGYFIVNKEGVTSSNINTILATLLTAQASGRQVTIQYNPTDSCYMSDISLGGITGDFCP
jgi:hypothetical protein